MGKIDFANTLCSMEVLRTSSPEPSDTLGIEEICQALEDTQERYTKFSGLVNASLKNNIQISADKLAIQLLLLIFEKHGEGNRTKVQHTFNRMNKFLAFQIFEWALSISTLLSEDQIVTLLVRTPDN
jgi:hypothetical protein